MVDTYRCLFLSVLSPHGRFGMGRKAYPTINLCDITKSTATDSFTTRGWNVLVVQECKVALLFCLARLYVASDVNGAAEI